MCDKPGCTCGKKDGEQPPKTAEQSEVKKEETPKNDYLTDLNDKPICQNCHVDVERGDVYCWFCGRRLWKS